MKKKPVIITAVEARKRFGRIIERVSEGEHFIVEKFGKPILALIDAVEYQNLINLREHQIDKLKDQE